MNAAGAEPSIGVVIAVRDQAHFLGEALDSIAAQTLPTTQVIVVDNESVDGSGDVARARGIRTILGPGRGPAIARNLGVAELTTDLIAILDGDDRFLPEHHAVLSAALAETGAKAVSGRVLQFYDEGREAELAAKHPIPAEPLAGGVTGSMMIRRSAFHELGGFPQNEHEHDFFGLVRGLGDYPKIDDVVLERRIHGANRSITERDAVRAAYLSSARAAILAARRSAGEAHG